ncbi:hypothetical protein Cabys_3555 [Caldithrix abyssi DSM 13497]|uniref:Uncharacterized protein n=1 Tax=Caldithrix abyssi DSM 13497 TaxID=880073 RepID=A0A1J1CC85_CALAY|nr:hypothetical protein Cabys_3555 [Caldithrix abyssi DSM 13497]
MYLKFDLRLNRHLKLFFDYISCKSKNGMHLKHYQKTAGLAISLLKKNFSAVENFFPVRKIIFSRWKMV